MNILDKILNFCSSEILEIDGLINTVYEFGQRGIRDDRVSIDLYDVVKNKNGKLYFVLRKRCGSFNLEYYNELIRLKELEENLRSNGYVTKNEWLEEYKKNLGQLDFNLSDIKRGSKFSGMLPADLDKAAIICDIIKTLGYYNLEDIEILDMVIQEYDLHKDSKMIANVTTFLTEALYGEKPLENTTLYEEHQAKGKIYQFRKISKKITDK